MTQWPQPFPPILLSVPNVSEGRDPEVIGAVAGALTRSGEARLLDVHSDIDHHRSVYTLAAPPGALAGPLLEGAKVVLERVDLRLERGLHPRVGALDVLPLVYLNPSLRGAACAEALLIGDLLAREFDLPVFLYGPLAGGRSRADLRRGGLPGLAERIARGELTPDFGSPRPHPTAGATLLAAREPLVAFNLELAPPATPEDARRIASLIREGGPEGLPGLRAIGLSLDARDLPPQPRDAATDRREAATDRRHAATDRREAATDRREAASDRREAATDRPDAGSDRREAGPDRREGVPQLSMNVERPSELPLAEVIRVVARHAPIARAELVGLAPGAALEGFPAEVPMPGFDPSKHVIEKALGL